jgi:demethylmenaquinone methyltransferase/2-methoxy-6-polyprenyl-1,4-benzoquinol methylase
MQREQGPQPGGVLPPHPTLERYYERDADRPQFIRRLFDVAARDYDTIEGGMAMGTGRWYRREALRRAGLAPGMRVLDVAIGTGLVAREASRLAGDPHCVIGLDPSAGMLAEARRKLGVTGLLGIGERLPVRTASIDFVSMGYALRHLADLTVTFSEFLRVLRPGGIVCVLELTRPQGRMGFAFLRLYLRRIVPILTRLRTRNAEAELLMRYFWDTIENCVPPGKILTALDDAGFAEVRRLLAVGLFSEYTGRKAGPCQVPVGPSRKQDRDNFFVRRMAR